MAADLPEGCEHIGGTETDQRIEAKACVDRPGIFSRSLREIRWCAHGSCLRVGLPQHLLVHLADAGARDRVDQSIVSGTAYFEIRPFSA